MNNDDINLSERKKEILLQVVDDYIKEASPITSGSIQEQHYNDISSATLRTELKSLEEMGYLKQLHTSGGRIPTTKGYRFFVNLISKECPTNIEQLENIQKRYMNRATNLSDLVYKIANIISEATNYPAVVFLNGYGKLIINNIKIIPLITKQALMLIETNTGLINNTIELKEIVDENACTDAGKFFTQKFKGKTIEEMVIQIDSVHKELKAQLYEFCEFFDYVLNTLYKIATEMQENATYSTSGATKMLNQPEYMDTAKVKEFIDILDNKQEIMDMLNKTCEDEVTFKIGDENENEALKSCSVAKARFKLAGEDIGSIDVIGPKRMDYAKISSALKFVVDEFANQNLIEKGEDKK